jgi:hypothetical protein
VQGDEQHSAGRSYRALVITTWQILFLALLFARALTAEIDYDEEQYVAAGVMARHLMLYRDFIYLQSPADPLLLTALFSVSGGHYLLTARLLSGALAGAIFWLTTALARRYGVGRGSAVALASIALLSPYLDRPIATARNDILPLFLFLAGLLVYIDAGKAERPRRWLAAAGFLVGLAVEAKISYVFAPVALLLHALWQPGTRMSRITPLAAGVALAALPGLYYLATVPDQAWYDLLQYHTTAPLTWYQRQGEAALLTPEHRLEVLAVLLAWGSNGSLALLVAGLAGIRLWQGARDPAPPMPSPGLLGLLVAFAALVGFQPSPTWPMYYAPLAPLFAALIASMFMRIRTNGPPALVPLLLGIAALPSLLPLWHAAETLPGLVEPESWPGVQVHRQAIAIRDLLRNASLTCDVATLFPTHVLDANVVRPEFSSGPFFFRTADLVPAARAALLHGTSAGGLEALFAEDPPAAILGGLAYGQWPVEMDAGLRDYAKRHRYRPVPLAIPELWPKGSWLYLRDPATATPP